MPELTEKQQLMYYSLLRVLNDAVDRRIQWRFRPQRSIRIADGYISWGCGTQSDHYHRWRWSAWLCGMWQYLRYKILGGKKWQ